MSNYPEFKFARADVKRAGKSLSQTLLWADETEDALRSVFEVANSWRNSHLLPMRRMHSELVGQVRRAKTSGITAARLKRMVSIRKKLQRIISSLDEIQDLGGCRAIVPTMDDVRRLVEVIRESSRHYVGKEDSYISVPKSDGYRSHHLLMRFSPRFNEEEIFAGRRIELQIRTRLQHSWATAVEAIGMFRNEDIKGGGGSPEWRRLLKLMSDEIAEIEGCPLRADAPLRQDRVREIKELEASLGAVALLGHIGNVVRYLGGYNIDQRMSARYFLVQYDNSRNEVSVRPYREAYNGVISYDEAEFLSLKSLGPKTNSVLVEAKKIKGLREAFPNYFGDVNIFRQTMMRVAQGKRGKEYAMPPQLQGPIPPKEPPIGSWFRRHSNLRG